MKLNNRFILWMNRIVLFLVASTTQTLAWAQDKKLEVDINTKSEDAWYAAPWVWVVGAAVFILLLVALLRGGGRRTDV